MEKVYSLTQARPIVSQYLCKIFFSLHIYIHICEMTMLCIWYRLLYTLLRLDLFCLLGVGVTLNPYRIAIEPYAAVA